MGGRPTSQKPVFVLKMRDEGHKNIDLGTKNEEKKKLSWSNPLGVLGKIIVSFKD